VADSALAPLSQIADLCIVTSSRSGSFFPSNAAAHVFVNVLVTFLSMQDRRGNEKRLTRIDGVLERFHSFAAEPDKRR
jgi:DNA-binding MurR/RpiR family transcriptional regulator